MKHAELIARLEAAEVGSRELDALVCVSLGYVGNNQGYAPRNVRISDGDGEWLDYELGPIPYTARIPEVSQSLDAALALALRVLPPHGPINLGIMGSAVVCIEALDPCADYLSPNVYAKTPALALCIAILRALDANN